MDTSIHLVNSKMVAANIYAVGYDSIANKGLLAMRINSHVLLLFSTYRPKQVESGSGEF